MVYYQYLGGDMPYGVEKRGDKWVTINTDTGDVKGTHDTKEKAQRQMRLLYHLKSGGKLTK
jgi:hypothetical protein